MGYLTDPGVLESEGRHADHDIDPAWRKPDLDDHFRLLKVLYRDPERFHRGTESNERDQTRGTLFTWGSIHTSRSPGARGMPWTATAWAPTTRNRARTDSSSARRSVKSSFKRLLRRTGRQPPDRSISSFVLRHGLAGQGPCLDSQRPHHREPLFRRRRPAQVISGLVTQPELAHRPVSTCARPRRPPGIP